jgi:hypothetical protein
MKIFLSSVFLLFFLTPLAIAQSSTNTIPVGGKLTEEQRIYSPNKTHYLTIQDDGNLCIYTSSDKFVWCSMADKGSGSYLIMQADGNLVVQDRNNKVVWASETQAYFDPKYGTSEWKPVRTMLDDNGLLGLYNAANELVWNNVMGKLDIPIPVAVAVTQPTESIPVEGYTGPTERRQMNIVLPMSNTAQNIEVEIADGKVIYQSDIILGDVGDFNTNNAPAKKISAKAKKSRLWPNSTIPYVLPGRHIKRNLILLAIKELEEKTNLCVVPRTNQKDYVEFITRNGSWAILGKSSKGGRQEISIGRDAPIGTVVHEILHTAGFYHEQSREDRDNYVSINYANIKRGFSKNFVKQGKETNIGVYDFSSVMHYPAMAWSKNNRNTINFKNPQAHKSTVMGQRNGLSPGDIAAVKSIYNPGPCKPSGNNLVSSNTDKPSTTSTQTTEPKVATTTPNPTPTRPTGTETSPTARIRPTNTKTNPPVRTRTIPTETSPTVRTRSTNTKTNPPVRTRTIPTETSPTVRTRPTETTNPNVVRTKPVDNSATLKYRGQMKPGDRLLEGEKMVSPNGKFQLRGAPDGNFVIEEIPNGRKVYTFPLSNQFGEGAKRGYLNYAPDGNICIQSSQNKTYCATNGRDPVAPVILNKSIRAELTNDGRLRLIGENGNEIWATTPPAKMSGREPQTKTPVASRTGQPKTSPTSRTGTPKTPLPMRTGTPKTKTPLPMRTGTPKTATTPRTRQGKTSEPITDGKSSIAIPNFTPNTNGLVNLALLPIVKTRQSYRQNAQFSDSQKAVDGNMTSPGNSVSQTPPCLTPYWQVDLGQLAEVEYIVIWNSSEATKLKGRSFYVTTGAIEIHSRPFNEPLAPDNPQYDSDVFGRDASGKVESLGPYTWESNQTKFIIPINRTARKIRISLQKEGVEMTPLSLTEVEVYGKPYVSRRR